MRNIKSSVSVLALGALLSTSLILGGCGKKDKGDSGKTSAKIEKVASRKVNDAEASKALGLMGLDESGTGNFSWAGRKGNGGNYTFSNLTSDTDEDNSGTLGTMALKGVHMEGDQAVFDQITFDDFVTTGKDGEKVTFKNFTLTEPSPALAAAFTRAFKGDDDAFDNMEGDVSFKAMSFSGLKVDDEDGVFTMDTLKMGTSKDKTGYFTLNDLNMDMKDDGKAIKMNLGSIDVTGVNLEKYKGIFAAAMKDEDVSEETMKKLMSSMNAYNPDYKDFSLNDFSMDVAGMKINLDRMSGKADKKGGKIVMTSSMSPLTITPPGETEDRDLKKFVESLSVMGYDKLELTMEQNSVIDEKTDTMTVKDSYIQLKDGFKLSFDYDMVGYKAFMEKAASMQGQKSSNPMAALGMMNELKFNKMRIALRDDSIIDRSFKLAAKEQGGTPDALRQQAKMGLAFLPMMAQNEGQQEIAGQLSAALGKLLDDGGTLVIDFNPAEAIDIGSVMEGAMSGDIDVKALGLTIETK